jgi:serine/threonine protein kinase
MEDNPDALKIESTAQPIPMSDDVRPGRRIASFLIERQIGLGSFASVWKAHHQISHATVAVKVISKSSIDSQVARTRLQREIALLKQLDHPFIAELFQVAEDSSNYYLVMEFVEHGNLMDYVNDHGQLSEDQARRYFLQLVSVLEYLHVEKRIAHRDLKCENVLLDRYNNIRLIDFGLSNMFSDAAPSLQTACGSPAYAAPEMVLGGGYTQAADVWSAGVLLFSIAAGFLPFEDDQIQRLLQKIVYSEVEYPKEFSPQLVDLLKKMLCKDQRERITAGMIKQHPWFSQVEYALLLEESRLGEPISGDHDIGQDIVVDGDIIQAMTGFGIDCRELAGSLLVREFTDLTALYRIFRREKLIEKNRDLFRRITAAATRPATRGGFTSRPYEEPRRTALSNVHVAKSVTPPPLGAEGTAKMMSSAAPGTPGGRRVSRPVAVRKPKILSPAPMSRDLP